MASASGLAMMLISTLAVAAASKVTSKDYARTQSGLHAYTAPQVDHVVHRVTWLDDTHVWYIDHDARADHDIIMSPDGKYFGDSWSTVARPLVTVLHAPSDGHVVATIDKADILPLKAAGWHPPEVVKVKARDGRTTLYGLMFKPANFDPHKKYPIADYIYSCPQVGSVSSFGFQSARIDHQAIQTLAGNLKGRLMLVHGSMDDNVPMGKTLLVVDALIKANKEFDLLIASDSTISTRKTVRT